MTPTPNLLSSVTRKIVERVPDVRWKICHHGEQAECEHLWNYRDITLDDVLRWFTTLDDKPLVSMSDEIRRAGFYNLTFASEESACDWTLGQPLSSQSQDCLQFLNSIL